MANEMMSNWSHTSGGMFSGHKTNMKTGKSLPKSKGNLIMEIADRILPWIKECLDGVRDNDGMLVQPAAMRAIALNTAQLYLDTEQK